MAVINRTPDSFYDQGATYELGAALAAADRAVRAGAEILDIGGVKAGPGDDVTVAEEIRRVVPVVAALRDRHPEAVLSVDTASGNVTDATMAQSIGNPILDNSTVSTFRRWRFQPGKVAPKVKVPITYTMTGASY